MNKPPTLGNGGKGKAHTKKPYILLKWTTMLHHASMSPTNNHSAVAASALHTATHLHMAAPKQASQPQRRQPTSSYSMLSPRLVSKLLSKASTLRSCCCCLLSTHRGWPHLVPPGVLGYAAHPFCSVFRDSALLLASGFWRPARLYNKEFASGRATAEVQHLLLLVGLAKPQNWPTSEPCFECRKTWASWVTEFAGSQLPASYSLS